MKDEGFGFWVVKYFSVSVINDKKINSLAYSESLF